ncbi:hypothetical protein JNG37_04925 [Streptococcus suis]|uniref:Uncharacterized protein n=1 Tax=Streptococcus suis TaxID=1307 RepID=A0A4T2GKK1_STRSU|nr:hypothetical protein [Streptococcus suis]MBM7270231.1 hypothetical protein [Streptococcus suis]TIH99498.1 hypothetical protein FAJ39_07965 [Streptococcus suis]
MEKIFRALPLIVVAGAVVYLSIWIWIDNGDWTYIIARVSGMTEKHANNLSLIAIAIQSLFFTSDWFYSRIRAFLNRQLERTKGLNRQIYLGYKAGIEFLMALPKRTILFSFYLLLTILENLGVIDSAKDYAVIVIFIIAVDRVTKIWPEEKRRMMEFGQKIKKRIKSVE